MNTPPTGFERLEERDLIGTRNAVRERLIHVAERILALRASGLMKQKDKEGGEKKNDLVTEADELSERLIVEFLRQEFPDDQIGGEEGGEQGGTTSPWRWEIDPIDGTINFSRGDECGISVGLLYEGRPVLGVIHFLHDNTQMYGSQGGGAFLHDCVTQADTPLTVAGDETPELKRCHLVWDRGYGDPDPQLAMFATLQKASLYTTSGACYLAGARRVLEGKRDAYINAGPGPFDAAASVAIALEAGASVEGIKTEALDFSQKTVPTIIARSAHILKQVKAVLAAA